MKKMNKNLMALLCFSIAQNSTIMSSVHPTTIEFDQHSSGIYVIHEDEDGSDDCALPENGSGKGSTSTGELTRSSFLDDVHNNDPERIRNIISAIDDKSAFDDEFYITDNKEDLPAVKENMPIEVYHHLMAAGGGLNRSEYQLYGEIEDDAQNGKTLTKLESTLLKQIEDDASNDVFSVESHVRRRFVNAIMQGDIEMVKSLCDIDTCLRYNNYVNFSDMDNAYKLQHGPLMKSPFDYNLTALHYAIANNQDEIAQYFIENGARLNVLAAPKAIESAYNPQTPLDYAMVYRDNLGSGTEMEVLRKNSKIIDMLMNAGVQPKSIDRNIQGLIKEYLEMKNIRRKPVVAQQKPTMYQSMKDLFGTSSSVAPM